MRLVLSTEDRKVQLHVFNTRDTGVNVAGMVAVGTSVGMSI